MSGIDQLMSVPLVGAGAISGSFLNVVIHRVPAKESIVLPPSHCPHCDTHLAPGDLIPIVSWLLLGGKCRYCDAPISRRYPFVEALTAALFAIVGWLGLAYVPIGIFMGFVLGSVVGVALMVSSKADRRTALPFGPFLAAGALLTIAAGPTFVDALWRF